jgi:hypothetical protein
MTIFYESRISMKDKPYSEFVRIKDTLIRRDFFTKVQKTKSNTCVFTNCNQVVAEIACTLEDVEKVLEPITD